MPMDPPVRLTLHGREIHSVFQLLGHHENDMTYSLGWVLAHSPSLLGRFLSSIGDFRGDVTNGVIRLQEHEDGTGITDIEIEVLGEMHAIVEAKRGWHLPEVRPQLLQYAQRLQSSTATIRLIVALSECSYAFVEGRLPAEILGIPVRDLSWKEVARLARDARSTSGHKEKRLLDELLAYLGGLVTMQNRESNWVYVVSLAAGTPEGWAISWIDIVRERGYYFHPIAGGKWPKEPPNYIAFRYSGALQSIYHVDRYEAVTSPHERIPEVPDGDWSVPLFLYSLAGKFAPDRKVPTGKIWPSGRVWCMLDTLFTAATIADARDESYARLKEMS
jgi:hypothetical protein